METKHNFVELAEVQREQETLYCAGLDPHSMGNPEKNKAVYGSINCRPDLVDSYFELARQASFCGIGLQMDDRLGFATVMAQIESYLLNVIDILVEKCNIRVFKPQYGFYEQFGFMGSFLLMQVRNYIKHLEHKEGIRLICILDCKRGDIDTTQAAYFQGLIGNLYTDWGINYAPYDFDIINVTPYMGSDVMVLNNGKGQPGLGLKLMRQGKGIIGVNKTSNPSGPEYQELRAQEREGKTIQMCHVEDLYEITKYHGLEYDELSAIGLVVGSTHPCDGSIRKAFPSTTLLVPGFGAQGGKFSLIMPELIREGKWDGQGAIFSSSRGTLYPFEKKYGGSGEVKNLESDLVKAIQIFREKEEEAYSQPEVIDAGIIYPFKK
ncbi:MAG: orotidine 5'-phosphate decarboxylase [Candidatus Moranbacteria bacterium RIFCSPHIGHO2_02_FULL_40_12b]|nr:MAG: orotidine 5'-phosphate decarboxylase [Candidatus Moranbacteria bacterium RIFCSPHIGHO2_02_FULL_40_12b]